MSKMCPLTGKDCLENQCEWWVNIESEGYQCAVASIAYDLREIASTR